MTKKFKKIKVYGDSTMDGKLVVKRKLKAKGTLSVSGPTTVSGKFKSKGNIECQGQLNVYGETVLEGETNVNGELNVNGSTTITGTANINDLNINGILITEQLLYNSPIVNNPSSISQSDSGTIYNIDASSDVSVNLPNVAVGLIYTFIVSNGSATFTINLSGSNTGIGVKCYNGNVDTFTTNFTHILNAHSSIGDKYEIIGISSTQWHIKCVTVNEVFAT